MFHEHAADVVLHRSEQFREHQGRIGSPITIVAAVQFAARSINSNIHADSAARPELDQLPARIAFVGAGYISFEFAHVARRAGAQATIVGRGKPLQHFEQDLVARLVNHTQSLGIELRLDAEVTAIEPRGAGCRLWVNREGRTETVEADLVVHGGGRVPITERPIRIIHPLRQAPRMQPGRRCR